MSNETYVMMQNLNVDERAINYLCELLNEDNNVLNQTLIDPLLDIPLENINRR